jgi:cystathionine beta-lyase/cystathionine gamma-synthase
MPPVYQTTTFAQTSPGKPIGDYEYSRTANPTRALENALASLKMVQEDWLFIWVSGNRLLDARIESRGYYYG